MNTAVLPELTNSFCGSVGVPVNAAPVAVFHISMVTPEGPAVGVGRPARTATRCRHRPTVGVAAVHDVAGEVLSPVGVFGAWS